MINNQARQEHGVALLIIVMLVAILSFIFAGYQFLATSSRSTLQQMNVRTEAENAARGGLTDTITWFRNQSKQPVGSYSNTSAYPYPDAAFAPLQSNGDTIDQSLGLVQEYPLRNNSNLYARYQVLQQANPATNPWNSHAVHDITASRLPPPYYNGQGLAWYIESAGYIYIKNSSTTAYNQWPNRVLANASVSVEIRRIALNTATSALTVDNPNNVTLTNNGRLAGGTTTYTLNNSGLAYTRTSSPPNGTVTGYTSGTSSWIHGNPAIQLTSSTATNFQTVFGLAQNDVKLMSDIVVNTNSPLPANYPSMALVYCQQSVTFDSTHPLRGGGLLIVQGDLNVSAGTDAFFDGVIYVQGGNVSISGPAEISGTVIVSGNGTVTLNGSGDVAEIVYDSRILNSVQQQVALYRENKATYYNFTGIH
jgi:hypothetical protein